MSFFGSRHVLELRFAITQQQKSVTGSRWYMNKWLTH